MTCLTKRERELAYFFLTKEARGGGGRWWGCRFQMFVLKGLQIDLGFFLMSLGSQNNALLLVHAELGKQFFLSTLTFWGYRYCQKKTTRKLQQFEITTNCVNH